MKFQSTMKPYDAAAYVEAGCQFAKESPPSFLLVYMGTQHKVCDTGCAWFDGGRCPAYRRLTIPSKPAAQQEPQESVRDTAKRLGISISEVRRRRRTA